MEHVKTLSIDLITKEGIKPRVRFKHLLDADDLDPLISALGRLRAEIGEPLPSELPDGHEVKGLEIQPLVGCEISRDLEGTVLILRDTRFGWLAFRMTDAERAWMIDGLLQEEQAAQRAAQSPMGSAH